MVTVIFVLGHGCSFLICMCIYVFRWEYLSILKGKRQLHTDMQREIIVELLLKTEKYMMKKVC